MTAAASQQPDLFSTGAPDAMHRPGLVGFSYAADFLHRDEEAALIARIDAEQLSRFKFQQWEGKRLTAAFGWSYDFTTGRLGRAAPLPDWLLTVRDRATSFAGLPPSALVQALLIRYDPGAGIGWHKDRPMFEHVIGISLGNAATMRLRRRTKAGFDRKKAPLAPRSIYHLSGEARHGWEHSIAPIDVPRWSITFRTMA